LSGSDCAGPGQLTGAGMLRTVMYIIDLPFRLAAYALITIYRYSLSAFVGRTCRYLPTCSEFTRDAIWRFGFWPGGWMGLMRILSCGPGGAHGYDPVPKDVPGAARWYLPWRYGRRTGTGKH